LLDSEKGGCGGVRGCGGVGLCLQGKTGGGDVWVVEGGGVHTGEGKRATGLRWEEDEYGERPSHIQVIIGYKRRKKRGKWGPRSTPSGRKGSFIL